MPASWCVTGIAPTAAAIHTPAERPAKMPIPPKSGVGLSCQRSLDGTATSLCASGVRKRMRIASAQAGRAAIAARVLTRFEGRSSVLGACVPSRSLPRLEANHDGLRRSAALPGALLQPLPARFPGQVQGLAARRRLVAPQPAPPARGLPARLRRHLQHEQDAALSALPPRRALVLDLLRDVAAVVGALARRFGGADQEGSVSASARRLLD